MSVADAIAGHAAEGHEFTIGSLLDVERLHEARGLSAVLTIIEPDNVPRLAVDHHLVLAVHDIDQPVPGMIMATHQDVERILAFGRDHAGRGLFIHCYAGISRSSASGLAILAERYGPGEEERALNRLLEIRPMAVPNRHIVRLADEILGRGGRLFEAFRAWDEASPANQRLRAAARAHMVQFLAD